MFVHFDLELRHGILKHSIVMTSHYAWHSDSRNTNQQNINLTIIYFLPKHCNYSVLSNDKMAEEMESLKTKFHFEFGISELESREPDRDYNCFCLCHDTESYSN